MAARSINPATEEEVARYEFHTDSEVESLLSRSAEAFRRHRSMSFAARAKRMARVADLLEERAADYGALMTREMGKPIEQAEAEAKKCAWVCRYYAENAERQLRDEQVQTDAVRSMIAHEPLGSVLAVMPWNYPFWQVFRFVAPALMAGNAGLLKHASNVFGCAEAIAAVLEDGGFDPDLFRVIKVDSDRVGDLIKDRRVAAATLTGSDRAGRSVGAAAGKAIKPCVLELGGSDAFIVLEDADLEKAVSAGVTSRMQNNGQSCIAAKRFIVHERIAGDFLDAFVSAVEDLSVGDPSDRDVDVGPLAREDLRDEVAEQVKRAVEQGARAATGGDVPDRKGWFYTPTVLSGVSRGSVAFGEEIFGPVASIIVANSEDDAVQLANDSRFGLGGAVFTRDRDRGERIARRLEVGCAFVNGMVKSDPRLPFGGVKDSGYGRELAVDGIRAFVNRKTIWMGE